MYHNSQNNIDASNASNASDAPTVRLVRRSAQRMPSILTWHADTANDNMPKTMACARRCNDRTHHMDVHNQAWAAKILARKGW